MFSWVGCPRTLTQLTFPTACSPAAVLSLQGGYSPAVGPTPAPPPWTAGVAVLLWRATVDRRASLTRTCSRWRAGSCADVPTSPRLQSRTGTTITYCFPSQRSRLAGESLLLFCVCHNMGLLTIFIHSFKDGMRILHTSKTCSNSTDVAENIYIHIKLKHICM